MNRQTQATTREKQLFSALGGASIHSPKKTRTPKKNSDQRHKLAECLRVMPKNIFTSRRHLQKTPDRNDSVCPDKCQNYTNRRCRSMDSRLACSSNSRPRMRMSAYENEDTYFNLPGPSYIRKNSRSRHHPVKQHGTLTHSSRGDSKKPTEVDLGCYLSKSVESDFASEGSKPRATSRQMHSLRSQLPTHCPKTAVTLDKRNTQDGKLFQASACKTMILPLYQGQVQAYNRRPLTRPLHRVERRARSTTPCGSIGTLRNSLRTNEQQLSNRSKTAVGIHHNHTVSNDVHMRSTKSAGHLRTSSNTSDKEDLINQDAIIDLATQLDTYVIQDNLNKFQATLQRWGPETQKRTVSYKADPASGSSVFFRACQLSRMKFIELMLDQRLSNLEQTGVYTFPDDDIFYQVTPLWFAAASGNLDLVRLLTSYGADVNAISSSGSNAIAAACCLSNVAIVSFLIAHDANIHVRNARGMTCLMNAVRSLELTKLMTHHGAKINEMDHQGNTAVHYAAEFGRLDTVKLLVEMGGNPLIVNNEGCNALYIAAECRRKDVVEYLMVTTAPPVGDIINTYLVLGVMSIIADNEYPTGLMYWRKGLQLSRMKRPVSFKTAQKSSLREVFHVEDVTKLEELASISKNPDTLCLHALLLYERLRGPKSGTYLNLLVYRGAVSADVENMQIAINLWKIAYKLSIEKYLDTDKDCLPCDIFNSHLMEPLIFLVKSLYRISCYSNEDHNIFMPEMDFTDLFRLVCYHISVAASMARCVSKPYSKSYTFLLHSSLCLFFIYLQLYSPSDRSSRFGAHIQRLIKFDPRDEDEQTLLHMCLQRQTLHITDAEVNQDAFISWPSHAMIEILILLGADPTSRDRYGNSAIHLAVQSHNQMPNLGSNTVEMLLKLGAHADQVNKEEKTAASLLPPHDHQLRQILQATTLRCLAARVVAKYRIPYIGEVPESLYRFIRLHCSRS